MGNPLSPLLSEIFMAGLEKTMERQMTKLRDWLCYVDGVLAIVKEGDKQDIIDQINKWHPNIKFTMEEESNGGIPFLDIKVLKRNNGFEFVRASM